MDDVTAMDALLTRASTGVSYPPTPDVTRRVMARIQAGAPERRPAPRLTLAATLAGAVAIAVAVTLAVPASRSAVAEFFGIERSRIERLPTPVTGTPTPLPTATGLETVATPASLDAAAQAAGFAPVLPEGYGSPEGVYLVDYAGPAVVLHYAEFDLWESRTRGFFQKGLPAKLLLHEFLIRGRGAAWRPHSRSSQSAPSRSWRIACSPGSTASPVSP